jgi:hypothetical protein
MNSEENVSSIYFRDIDRTMSAAGNPTQNICMTMLVIIPENEKGIFGTADRGTIK